MNVRIRPATVDDVAAVLALWRAADAEPSVTDDAESIEALIALDAEGLLLAEADGVVIGTLVAAWDGWRGNLYRLAVLLEHRRQGVARRLLEEGERRLRSRGARRVAAIVVSDHDDAMAFWRAAGYEEQERRTRFVTSWR